MSLYICPKCRSIMRLEEKKCSRCSSETIRSDSINWKVIGHVELFSTPEGFPERYHLYLLESSVRRMFCFSELYYNDSAALFPDVRDGKMICMPVPER
jgi:hypothetical protein